MTVKCPDGYAEHREIGGSSARGNKTAAYGNEIIRARELFTGEHDEAMTKDASEESR